MGLVAVECFRILRSHDYTVMLYDDEGNRVTEPEEARRMFAQPQNILLSLIDEGDDSAVRLYIGKGTDITAIKEMSETLRLAASRFNMLYNISRHGGEIRPKDFATRSSVREGLTTAEKSEPEPMMDLTEGMHGTSRSSYLKMPRARMIVRHKEKIDPDKHGARARHIESIFCENKHGERFRFPTRHLAPARAMTQHLSHGGEFSDDVGKRLQEMAQEYARLSEAARHIQRHSSTLVESDEAMKVRESCRAKMIEMRRLFERMSRTPSYESAVEQLNEQSMLAEGDEADTVGPEYLEEMRKLLTADGATLTDPVLEAACRAAKGIVESKKETKPMVSVLGRPVDLQAWNDLKAGKIAMKRQPTVDAKEFTSRTGELALKLMAVAEVCEDDTLSTLFAHVVDGLQGGHASTGNTAGRGEKAVDDATKMRVIALAAVKAAGLPLQEPGGKSKAINEFASWLRAHGTKALLEMAYPDDYDSWPNKPDADSEFDRGVDQAVASLMAEVTADDYLNATGTHDFYWNRRDSLSDEEKEITASEVRASVQHWLETELERRHDTSADLSAEVGTMVDEVIEKMKQAGYSVMEHVGEALTREDVLLPSTDQGEELRRQVTKGKPDGSAVMTNDETRRMRTLAGLI